MSGTSREWYVVAVDPDHTNVFGPFVSEIDARAFAIDLHNDNGWLSVEPQHLYHEDAANIATDKILWPYTSGPDE